MNVLITGGAGFIGSHVVDAVLAHGHSVLCLDDLSTGRLDNLAQHRGNPNLDVVELDICAPGVAPVVAEFRPDATVHLAAAIDVRHSVSDPVHDALVNVVGTVNVLEASRAAGSTKFVFISSGGSIYGAAPAWPADEGSPVAPESPYAASKAAAELWLATYQRLHGTTWTALALANVYGPRQRTDGEGGVVAIFAAALLGDAPITIFGDGAQTRDFVYVADVAAAAVTALDAPSLNARVNIGTGTETSVLELHARMAALTGGTNGVGREPHFAAARPGELQRSVLATDRAIEGLGWRPVTALDDGLRATIDWARHNVAL